MVCEGEGVWEGSGGCVVQGRLRGWARAGGAAEGGLPPKCFSTALSQACAGTSEQSFHTPGRGSESPEGSCPHADPAPPPGLLSVCVGVMG